MQKRIFWGLRSILGVLPMMLVIVGTISEQVPAQNLSGQGPSAQRRAASEYVSKALQAETEGKNSRRDALLEEALEASPDYAPARWHSGYVWADNRWLKFDEVPAQASQNRRVADYRSLRQKYRETVEDQLALAAWCKKVGLVNQWRAHLGNVLALNPDHQEARLLLGYQRVDGVWLTPQEIGQGKARAAAAVAALKLWQPKLLAIRSGLQNSNPNRREVARQRLAAIQDAAAVPSLELVLCGDTEPMAQVGVKKFAEMTVADSSLALARQALFSRWEGVRKAAVEKLKARNRETFIPELLSAMASPTQSRAELYQDPAGRLLYRHAFYQPGQERDELVVLDTMYDNNFNLAPYLSSNGVSRAAPAPYGGRYLQFDDGTLALVLPNRTVQPIGPQTDWSRAMIANIARYGTLGTSPPSTVTAAVPANKAAAALVANQDAVQARAQANVQAQAPVKAALAAQAREMAVARQNLQTAALNAAIAQLLSDVTDVNLPPSPEAWSEWWAETDEVYVPGYKPLETTYVPIQNTTDITVPVPMREAIIPGVSHYSCLAAGTPIWTDAGPVAVEKIKVGDQVLSQNPETGELAYKPVMHTTIRLRGYPKSFLVFSWVLCGGLVVERRSADRR